VSPAFAVQEGEQSILLISLALKIQKKHTCTCKEWLKVAEEAAEGSLAPPYHPISKLIFDT